MKKSIIISLFIATIATALSASETVKAPVEVEFADKLVTVFGGKDNVLSQRELVRVLDFLQKNLPEQTAPTGMANRLSRENNIANAPRGELSDERFSIREELPERYAAKFIRKYDLDADSYVTRVELANALTSVIGTPRENADLDSGAVARN